MSSGKPHPLVDRFTRTLRVKSRETPPTETRKGSILPDAGRGVESAGKQRVMSDAQPNDRYVRPGTLEAQRIQQRGTKVRSRLLPGITDFRKPQKF